MKFTVGERGDDGKRLRACEKRLRVALISAKRTNRGGVWGAGPSNNLLDGWEWGDFYTLLGFWLERGTHISESLYFLLFTLFSDSYLLMKRATLFGTHPDKS